ncbi:MAG: hypothetical protein NTY46_14670 [Candidatus Sumerlaeota bacterium]|nr:hypothetical protein [Candidatus Sumerlaeota bacterium]
MATALLKLTYDHRAKGVFNLDSPKEAVYSLGLGKGVLVPRVTTVERIQISDKWIWHAGKR